MLSVDAVIGLRLTRCTNRPYHSQTTPELEWTHTRGPSEGFDPGACKLKDDALSQRPKPTLANCPHIELVIYRQLIPPQKR